MSLIGFRHQIRLVFISSCWQPWFQQTPGIPKERLPQKACRQVVILKGQHCWYFQKSTFSFIITAEMMFIRVAWALWEYFVGMEWDMSITSLGKKEWRLCQYLCSLTESLCFSLSNSISPSNEVKGLQLMYSGENYCLNYINILCH